MNRVTRLKTHQPSEADKALAFDCTGYNVIPKQFSQCKAIFSEIAGGEAMMLRALREGHNINFNSLTEDPLLFFVVDEQMVDMMKRQGIENPTILQLLGSARIVSDVSEQDAINRFDALMKGEN